MDTAAPTLSSIVSNFVRIMPSMARGFLTVAWSTRALLNLVSWSTLSLPTNASPTKSTLSGALRFTSLANSRIRTSLSCMRPAVSTKTTSIPWSAACLIPSMATEAGSRPYWRSNRGVPRRVECTLSCSTAPERNVSHATMSTFLPWCMSQAQTLARLVDLPTPLTPTNTILYGLPAAFAAMTSRRTSMDCFGVRILDSADSIAAFTDFLIPENPA
mmetsp:Transcript_13938/g.30238  ORF Transcript_13938/g.30238 Transcript_13938/m.30238 type:complete len:216 (-) Transcript_13938:1064-1711(-)